MFKKYVAFLIIIVIAFGAGYFLHSGIFNRDSQLIKKQLEEKELQIKELSTQSQKIAAEIKLKDEQAAIKDLEVAQLHSLISASNKSLLDEQAKISEAAKKYEEEINLINTPISPFQRCERLCRTRAELGYKCHRDFCVQYK